MFYSDIIIDEISKFVYSTYRRYISSLELLDLLIERFNIPNPDFTEAANETFSSIKERDGLLTVALRLEQRFRSVYKRRVQYRFNRVSLVFLLLVLLADTNCL
ncbi:unnamed protein product [Schistosoma mattheei]|uniref:Uncharacterized protein n=1 Tax=Schistosoma mattheei TaxID=31246 RepID=A0A183NLV9_9TREM|nr:unnamed protein product [Schistosoma mattheei]